MKVKIDIISGFLGAGKTTLIKKLINEKLSEEKIVIIENEFGQVGIDGPLLKSQSLEVREINSGCICCTLVDDFEKAIEEVIHTFGPDRIIIEPSGVGKLSDVIKACKADKLKDLLIMNAIITVVDVHRYKLYLSNFSEFYKNQIKHAKTIILSKTATAKQEIVSDVVNSIRSLNPDANIITTDWDKLEAEKMLAVAERDVSMSLEHQMKDIKKVLLKRHSHNHHADEVFDVWGAETPRIFSQDELKDMLDNLNDEGAFGLVLRGKGILQTDGGRWLQFDYLPGEVIINETDADYSGRLCIIGTKLNKNRLTALFKL
jgi:G3E family GTPase